MTTHPRPGLDRATLASMRVLYVTDRLSLWRGADRHLRDVVTAVVDRGIEARLIVGDATHAPPLPDVPLSVAPSLARPAADTQHRAVLRPLLEWADVVHVQNVLNPVALQDMTGTGHAIVTVQDHRFFCPGAEARLPDAKDIPHAARAPIDARKDALRGARILVSSTYVARELSGMGLSGAIVLPPWIGFAPRQPRGGKGFVLVEHPEDPDIPRLAWEAWRAAQTRQPLLWIGEPDGAKAWSGAQAVGRLAPTALYAQLMNARALLLPARWQEPFGILGVEALACGTPVILTPRGGMGGWAGSGCFPVHSVEEMVEVIRHLAAYPGEAAAIGSIGQQRVRERFSRPKLLERLLSVYEETAC